MEEKKKNIRYWIIASAWVVAGTGILVLLVAAMQSKGRNTCRGLDIQFKTAGKNFFIDKKDIQNILTANQTIRISGKPLKSFDLNEMEDKLKKNIWIKDAELFFDNNDNLKVRVREREPIARIFTSSGNSFYIDSSLERLPLSEKRTPRLPLFTNFPSDKPRLSAADSALLRQVKEISQYLAKDSFWMAQIQQIDINPQRNFEMIPTIGQHEIFFGDGLEAEKKFRRLMIFYREVLSRVGWTKYSIINVQYNGQVVATRKGEEKKATSDTTRVKQFFRQMMAQSQLLLEDSLDRAQQNGLPPAVAGAVTNSATPLKTSMTNPLPLVNPSPLKSNVTKPTGRPKAVMKKDFTPRR